MSRSGAGDTVAAEVRLLGFLLAIFAATEFTSALLGFASEIVAGAAEAERGALFWLPQLAFFAVFFVAGVRLRKLDPGARLAVMWLSAIALAAKVVTTMLVFALGPGRARPAFAAQMELTLLLAGGVWDVVFPSLALFLLARPGTQAVFRGPA